MGVCEDLDELRKVSKDLFDLYCLLKDQKFRDSKDRVQIEHRLQQMRQSYSFLEDTEPKSYKLGG